MPLIERVEPGKSFWATMAHLGRKIVRTANSAVLASFAGSRSVQLWRDVVVRELGTKATQLPHTNTLEPIGVPA